MQESIDSLIRLALKEDLGDGDVTSLYFVPEDRLARAFVAIRAPGVVSGIQVAVQVFSEVDPDLEIEILIPDGSRVAKGALLIQVEGKAQSILTAERTALNFLQRLSGVATLTAAYVDQIKDLPTRILDTRKTTPGYRLLEKQAVLHGGGTNHRIGLFDRAMIKDNHLVSEGNLDALQLAIRKLKAERSDCEVEIEVDDLSQVRDFLTLEGVDYLLLDNMSLADLRTAVELRGDHNKPRLEASGGVNLETLRDIAETGVDFISVGAITHSAPALDVALDFTPLNELPA